MSDSINLKFIFCSAGHDCARLRVRNVDGNRQEVLDHDEIATFLETRYVCAPEAVWRLSEYELQKKSHWVIRLQVHLPDEQSVVFNPGNEDQALVRYVFRVFAVYYVSTSFHQQSGCKIHNTDSMVRTEQT